MFSVAIHCEDERGGPQQRQVVKGEAKQRARKNVCGPARSVLDSGKPDPKIALLTEDSLGSPKTSDAPNGGGTLQPSNETARWKAAAWHDMRRKKRMPRGPGGTTSTRLKNVSSACDPTRVRLPSWHPKALIMTSQRPDPAPSSSAAPKRRGRKQLQRVEEAPQPMDVEANPLGHRDPAPSSSTAPKRRDPNKLKRVQEAT
ncbi:hypothetical protein HHK36_013494 [Tetracentron sinense]|uniref:Uncharacterized protein n=1 Tax=Tetracentron sinense TaxID=13715 RepID=A0A835DE81_TETSI|nr:hypothetical protein HHK36_013494 [Tetracentron sinense]